jgi:hypothetical protein
MTISSLNQTSEAFAAALPGLNARKPEELLPESDLVELSEDARTAQRQDTIGSADSLPGEGTRGSSEARDAADLPELAFSASEDRADESGGSAAQRVATLSYSFASEIPWWTMGRHDLIRVL